MSPCQRVTCSHPAPLSAVPWPVPRARLPKLMPQSHSSCVSALLKTPVFFRRLPVQRLDEEGAKRRTSMLEVRGTVATTSTCHSLPETVAVGDGGGREQIMANLLIRLFALVY